MEDTFWKTTNGTRVLSDELSNTRNEICTSSDQDRALRYGCLKQKPMLPSVRVGVGDFGSRRQPILSALRKFATVCKATQLLNIHLGTEYFWGK